MIAQPPFKGFSCIEAIMTAPKVEIYTRWGCGYCVSAKALLDRKGVDYAEIDVTMGGAKRAEMLERVPGATTVPQILIGGQPVGGSDDIHALDRAGKLDGMLGLAG
jgi:glutaredoxin 3